MNVKSGKRTVDHDGRFRLAREHESRRYQDTGMLMINEIDHVWVGDAVLNTVGARDSNVRTCGRHTPDEKKRDDKPEM